MINLSFRKTCYFTLSIIGIIILCQWCGDDRQPDDVESRQATVVEEKAKTEAEGKTIESKMVEEKIVEEKMEQDRGSEPNIKNQSVTFFYRLQYVIENGYKRDGTDNNGQFITFNGNSCYESDKFGNDVQNGFLSFSGNEDEGLAEVFTGQAYWGNNCKFVFTKNKRLLHIDTPDGRKIVYRRSTPPSGMTTCTLLRTEDEKARQAFEALSMDLERQRIEELSRINKNSSKNTSHDKIKPTIKSNKCPHCDGKGVIKIDPQHTASYGLSSIYKKCPVCNKEYDINSPHSHDCPHCGGTGKQ